jgi:hypothetical protein
VVLHLLAADPQLYQRWEQCGQRKIVVKVENAQSMVRVLISNTHCLPAAAAAVALSVLHTDQTYIQSASNISHQHRACSRRLERLKAGATVFHDISGWG